MKVGNEYLKHYPFTRKNIQETLEIEVYIDSNLNFSI